MSALVVLLAIGATFRVSRLLYADTWPPVEWARARLAPHDLLHEWMTCGWCNSPWIGAIVAPTAWFYGRTAWWQITTLLLTASAVCGLVMRNLDDS